MKSKKSLPPLSPALEKKISREVEAIFSFPKLTLKPIARKERSLEERHWRLDRRMKKGLRRLMFLAAALLSGWVALWKAADFFTSPLEAESVFSFTTAPLYHFNTHLPIYASPTLYEAAGGARGFLYGDAGGNVYASRNGKISYHFRLSQGLMSAPLPLEVDGSAPKEMLVVGEGGLFYTLNQKGTYLYRSREGEFEEKIFAKPASWKEHFFLSSLAGSVWAVHRRYGEIVWKKELGSKFASGDEAAILAAPLVVPRQLAVPILIVAQLGGTITALETAAGTVLWRQQLPEKVKAGLTIGDFLAEPPGRTKEQEVAVGGLGGSVFFLSVASGRLKERVALSASVEAAAAAPHSPANTSSVAQPPKAIISSLGKGTLGRGAEPAKKGPFLVALTQGGVAYFLHFPRYANSLADRSSVASAFTVFAFSGETFLASPVVGDFNQDGNDEVLAVTRSGRGYLLSAKEKAKIPLFKVGYNITATPLVADLTADRNLEIVLCGENGEVSVLSLITRPQAIFPKGMVVSGEFLKNSLNQN